MNKPKPSNDHSLSRDRSDKSGPFSMYDMCYDIAELLSDSEWNRYLALPKQQKDELREHAHDVTVNAIFKMMGC